MAVAVLQKEIYQCVAVCYLVLMYGAEIILGIACGLVYFRLFSSEMMQEELHQIYFVCITGLDCGCHLGVCGVADDDSVTACCAELLYRCGNLL